jgi:4-alpha-glucanotransferase
MNTERLSGVILHPTSLPGPDGIGDLGPEAFRWVDFLKGSGCALWQLLPLGPTGYGDSPYQCFSAFAGNPYLVCPTLLLEDGLIKTGDLNQRPNFPDLRVDYGAVIPWKEKLLSIAHNIFLKLKNTRLKNEYEAFIQSCSSWLGDFSLFMAIKKEFGGGSWNNWPEVLRRRDKAALKEFSSLHPDQIDQEIFNQFIFFRQWNAIRQYANVQGIRTIGDIPIFVSSDSSDAWSHPELFWMDKNLHPTVVAGVPPDYFSPTGQLWGNPLYRWSVHKKDGYGWWVERIKATLRLFDILRLDHFRGFAGYWEVPFGEETAIKGQWVPGPGASFFSAIRKTLGELSLIAEDLGEITPDVVALREKFDLPGMKILQFAFSKEASDPFLPHNYSNACVAYTGTHDNDTAIGWYKTATEHEKDFIRRYLACSGDDVSWDMIRSIWSSVADIVLTPMQDLLCLGSESRMNFPSKLGGNWQWRLSSGALDEPLMNRLKEMNSLYGRNNELKRLRR